MSEPRNPLATCATCRFGVRGYGAWLQCHKNAPGSYRSDEFPTDTKWPKVDDSDWCGQHESQEQA